MNTLSEDQAMSLFFLLEKIIIIISLLPYLKPCIGSWSLGGFKGWSGSAPSQIPDQAGKLN